ncbi:hypothetical protein PYW07_017245 [Mythimna separata]|uniref:HTH CENPB-type domain-containing protein n=1 Tax=Mythimna separata TaxID=271217 RepID=A0AAD7YJI8_MYTSE|nr:hypothetical protein PYW07_011384 [Mythimna separata]KAJ8716728.1 hypothetical protein PYW07_003355 [Mythimna separata]KAJ8730207.1 hypothetical protein PYW07_017245 [Mythimna separata]
MPRNYIRKTNKAAYSDEKLQNAILAVKNRTMSAYTASKHYNIPRSTIVNRIYERRGFKSNTLGRSTVLSNEVEKSLAKNIHIMEKYGFGLTRKELLEVVGEYVNKNCVANPFNNGMPGEDWFLGFKKRHGLSVKKPQPVEYARKNACRPDVIYPYFDLLEETINELNLQNKPAHIYNLDETSFSKDPSKSKVVGLKGFTSTRTISSPGKDNTTVLLGCNAQGEKLPPLIIYKGKNVWDEWTSQEAYPGTVYAATSNGWMESTVFENFFDKVFLPTVGDKRPILLIYDGHSTHVGLNIIEKARAAGITILKIPPHTSDVLQPLDLSVNKSFKDKWDALLVKWQRQNIGKVLPKKDFSKMIGQIWAALEPSVCSAGFRKAGIYPLNKNAVPPEKFNQVLLRAWKSTTKTSEEPDEIVDSAFSREEYRAYTATHETCPDICHNDNDVNLVLQQPNEFCEHTANQPELLKKIVLVSINKVISGTDVGALQPSYNIHESSILQPTETRSALQENFAVGSKWNLSEPSTSTFHRNLIEHNIKSVAQRQDHLKNNHFLENEQTSIESFVVNNELHFSLENCVPISRHHDISLINKQGIAPTTSLHTTCSDTRNSRVQILDDSIVTCEVSFEDLLLKSVKGGTVNRRKKVKIATGAELITHDEVYNRCKIIEAEKEQKTRIKEQKAKEKEEKRKTNEQLKKSKEDKNNITKIKNSKKLVKKNVKKVRKISTSSDSEVEINLDDESDADYGEYCKDLLDDIENEDLTLDKIIEAEKEQKVRMKEQKAKEKEKKRQANEKLKKSNKDKNNVSNIIGNAKKLIKKTDKKVRKLSTSSESEIEINLNDESDVDYGEYPPDLFDDKENDNDKQNKDLTLDNGDWVLVKFCTKKSVKHFVGVVLHRNGNGYPVIKYVRKTVSIIDGQTVFTFPTIDDISEIRHTEDIVEKLPKPIIGRRGQIIFKMLFKTYNIQ